MAEFERVTVVRPYAEKFRKQIFSILEAAGLHIHSRDIIPSDTTDEQVLKLLAVRRDCTLLIPFHGHMNKNKNLVNGITLYRSVYDHLPEMRGCPVVMPVDKFSAEVVEALVKLMAVDTVMLISEDELTTPDEVSQRVRAHVEGFRLKRQSNSAS